MKSFACMMSYELPRLVMILDTSKLSTFTVITKGKFLFGIPPNYSLSWNPRIGLFGFSSKCFSPSLLAAFNSEIHILKVPLDGFLGLGRPLVMDAMYWCLPLHYSSSSMLSFFHVDHFTTSMTFLGDHFSRKGGCFFFGTLSLLWTLYFFPCHLFNFPPRYTEWASPSRSALWLHLSNGCIHRCCGHGSYGKKNVSVLAGSFIGYGFLISASLKSIFAHSCRIFSL